MSDIPNFTPTEKQKRQHTRKILKKKRMDNDRLAFLKVRVHLLITVLGSLLSSQRLRQVAAMQIKYSSSFQYAK